MIKHKLLIADDHAMIRDGIKALLKQIREYQVLGEAANGVEAIEKYFALKPDLVILDISMPEMNGMDASKQILERDPDAKIIMLSMHDDEEYISRCIEQGVKGFVVKEESGKELNFAIRSVLDGNNYFSNHVQQVIVNRYANSAARKKQKETDVKLTTREIEIVKLISEGLTSQEMADKLFISPRTVETHRANLMKKVGVKNSIELVKRVEKMNLL